MTTIPAEQSLSFLERVHDVSVHSGPVPQPGPRQVLIEIAAVGICGSDVHYFDHGRIADFVVNAPLVLGHEASGTIRALGAEVTDRQVGQRVALEPQQTCGRCRQCLIGRYNLCPDVQFFATPPVHGAFAQYVVLDSHRAHPVPDSLSDEAAALIEPLSVGIWANKKAAVEPGDRVLVTGAGPVGLLCADVARSRGAWVAVSDTNAFRLQTAKVRGADLTVDAATGSLVDQVGEVDVVLECSGAPTAVKAAFAAAAPAARVVLVGMGAAEMELPVGLIQVRELWVTGTFRYANCYPAAIQLAASGTVDLDGLVSGRFGLDQVADALQAGRTDPKTLKPMVYPGR
ncbi:NAD(P)-dependent alcohol dehydrogenase [Microlunatus panaciterrae]|uniref:L-iditol 2-dehydrogenase n=1 Tax=Microlunatus panaciterrae TaxID=400768 RepID=A0ABS2RLK8_9ACTN|nr:NAD(P)-dependent alcohol dehydrogenase [Microlunatus panaciterrae]MBM7799890.1 L-iditol 2-dehydrogenase [Microlunatus panaciterrae]